MSESITFEDFGGQGPLLHFAHPNAYPPACFSSILEPLTDTHHVIAVHHRPLWPGSKPHEFEDWQFVADDLSRFLEQQGYRQVIGVGHSLGAVATMKVAWQRPDLFKALVLIEPVFLEPQILQQVKNNPHLADATPMVLKTRERRTHWPDRQSAFEHFRAKRVFRRWSDASLWAYVNGALVDTGAGEVTLAFSREWETQFYRRFPLGVWNEIPRVIQPTLAIRGAESDTLSPAAWQLWQELQSQATFVEIADAGHMVPLERPEATVAAILAFAERLV
jgi:pimeloyl-ACP methyl ester carboxylesterase